MLEAETMGGTLSTGDARIRIDANASGGQAVWMIRNATISKPLTLPASTVLTVRARGEQCSGAPQMVVSIDGTQRLSAPVASTTYADYTANIALSAGAHAVAVSFTNNTVTGCDRNLWVDNVTFSP